MLVDAEVQQLGLAGCITPFNPLQVQPASYDVTLGEGLLLPKYHGETVIVGQEAPEYAEVGMPGDGYVLRPGGFVLAQTSEYLHMPGHVAAKFEGKSSLGRLGLMTHITAGFIDPGFNGVLTLEIYNAGPWVLVLRPGIRIGQVAFIHLDRVPDKLYGHPDLNSHYQGSKTAVGYAP